MKNQLILLLEKISPFLLSVFSTDARYIPPFHNLIELIDSNAHRLALGQDTMKHSISAKDEIVSHTLSHLAAINK